MYIVVLHDVALQCAPCHHKVYTSLHNPHTGTVALLCPDVVLRTFLSIIAPSDAACALVQVMGAMHLGLGTAVASSILVCMGLLIVHLPTVGWHMLLYFAC